ncbi:hypothetical protein [Labedaea rhizosphaerae]|uniref:Antitoxin VbhA domain-containing protein n=1 Tax=Labedaea rhizosphaerae TaxID=598644 RepID=A0A4R6RWJ7_LABRH|nr:hypothetical protein [Labedaea rhizosphaerae]TDP90526.1 hypothetical protein EV186_11066 [Labedaea rhizosphaerae]
MAEKSGPDLAELTQQYRAATAALGEARDALADGIRDAYAAGMRQADIVRGIDHEWSGEYVRKILKADRSEV